MATVTEFAKAFNVKPNTIRNWTAQFGEFFSPEANPELGTERSYNENDDRVMALIGAMRKENAKADKIMAALEAGERGQWPPASFEEHQETQQAQAEQQTTLVTRLTATVAQFEGELNATKQERDRLIRERDQAQNEAREANERAIKAETELNILKEQDTKSFWDRLRGK